MKAIIFDIDGVVIRSHEKKEQIIKDILVKHNLYQIPGVSSILSDSFNRKIILEKIYEITPFNKEIVLRDINENMDILESNPIPNQTIIDFIKSNSGKYILCTNTSLPISGLDNILNILNIGEYFKETLAYETGSKKENIEYILEKYHLSPEEVLFIDDNINHINRIKSTGVHTLHFTNYDVDISKEINRIESK